MNKSTLPLGPFSSRPVHSLDETLDILIGRLLNAEYYAIRRVKMNPKHTAAKQRLLQGVLKELNKIVPPFTYVGHAPNDESNWGVWIDLGKLHEAEEKGLLVQDVQKPNKGRSRYVLVHNAGGLRLFQRRGWVELWRV